ncbi:MAG: Arc family DNA-binding protein [Bacteroidetes bacterium]|nr:Arc family DNA-binding protein [Bacteroidota bacterium]MBS1540812.1 Arc family DNA-binding protein [Bacteroidota bacterium]
MASVTIKNLPDSLYKKLKVRAKNNHRSINGEIVNVLTRELNEGGFDVNEFLKSAEKIRNKIKIPLTDDELIAIKNEGRP